ncbi:SDR family NAD(P)-dependent oxidoreductase [Opitutaceae bacterium TAV4]|nr:SDR family NAD(P)-dependent oxidoreductase [Opitutaceae bacterium TAV4]RRK02674.1 SDR family NAD(P)-dependent oxidoreductase [Opitutaceae bacterium TAV3]
MPASSSPIVSTEIRHAMGRYSTVIVTGGSSGIGRMFIERLLTVAPDLVVFNLSRRIPNIFHGQLNLRHIECDLSDPAALGAAAERVLSELKQRAPTGGILLINNSGFGGYGRVSEVGREHQLEMIDVNVRAVVDLTTRLLPVIEERGGTVLNVASLAGFLPTAYTATYGASKAFVLHWTLALDAELRGRRAQRGAWALAVCPGPVATEFFRRAGLREGAAGDALAFTVEGVVEQSLRALARGQSVCLPGWRPRWVARVVSVLPKSWVARIGARVLERYRMSRVAGGEGRGGES